MGGMGGAQPLAATMNGACFLGIDVDPHRIQRRLETGYCDRMARTPRRRPAHARARRSARGDAISVGLVGNCADVLPELVRRGFVPDVLTDQTSAHDPLNGYVPNGMTLEEARALRAADPDEYVERSVQRHGRARRGHAGSADARRGDLRLRQQHPHAGQEGRRGTTPSTSPASCPNISARCSAKAAGRSAGWRSPATRQTSTAPTGWRSNCSRTTKRWRAGLPLAQQRIHFQGLPARICWLGYGERAEFGVAINRLVRSGESERAHRDWPRSSGRRARWHRPSAKPKACATAPTPSPIGRCSTRWSIPPRARRWVSIHNGGGVGIGYSQHAGMVVVADGTEESERRLERVLTTDPGTGVIRHADAGYDEAVRFAAEHHLKRPMGDQ